MSEPATITVTRTGYTGSIEVSVTGLPAGVTADPLTIAAGTDSGSLVFRSTTEATLGASAMATVVGTGGGGSQNAPLQVYVQGPRGSLDTTFNGTGKVIVTMGATTTGDGADAVTIMPNGTIVVLGGGAIAGAAGTRNFAGAIALTADGQLDNSMFTAGRFTGAFTPGGSTADHFFAAGVQPDGKLVAAGFSGINGSEHYFLLARFTSTGALDPSFAGGAGFIETDFNPGVGGDQKAHDLAIKPDGSYVIGGFSGVGQFTSARYSAAGTLIGMLPSPPITGFAYGLAARSDNGVLVVGPAAAAAGFLRYTAGDTLDATFGSGTGATTAVIRNLGSDVPATVHVLPDNSFYVGGVTKNGTTFEAAVARFSEAGALDTAFNGVGYVTTPTNMTAAAFMPVATALTPDGQVILAYMIENGGATGRDFAWVRVGADGKINSSPSVITTDFANSTDTVGGVAVQADGRIVVAGTVASGGRSNFGIARYWP